jgi:hypothetical protein
MFGDDSARELMAVLKDLRETVGTLKERRSNAQEIHQHVNAGGHAVWVVVVMAAIIFTAAVLQGPRISNAERRLDRLDDYLSAIYQQVPDLKDKVEKNVNDHNHNETEGGKSQP